MFFYVLKFFVVFQFSSGGNLAHILAAILAGFPRSWANNLGAALLVGSAAPRAIRRGSGEFRTSTSDPPRLLQNLASF